MAQTKGSTNQDKQPEIVAMPDKQRVGLLANLILEIIIEEDPQE